MDLVRKGSANIVPWDLDIARNTVHLREPASARIKFDFPAKPMLGCIGVAAPGDFVPTVRSRGLLRRQSRLQRRRAKAQPSSCPSTILARCYTLETATR